MFGERCLGYVGCGHATNWTRPCTCDEVIERDEHIAPASVKVQTPTEIERRKTQIEGMALYVQHQGACEANDFDYLDKTPCICGLRTLYNPKRQSHDQRGGAGE